MRKVSTEGQTLARVPRANLRQHLLISTVESEVRRCLQAQSRRHFLLSNKSFFQLVGAERTLPKYRHSARGQRRQFGDVHATSVPRPSRLGVSRRLGTDGGLIDQRRLAGTTAQLAIPTNCSRSLWSRSLPSEIAILSRPRHWTPMCAPSPRRPPALPKARACASVPFVCSWHSDCCWKAIGR